MNSDNATVVSICNFQIGPESKPGLFPGIFTIPAGTPEEPGILIVTESFHDIPQLDYKSIRVNYPAKQIAKSIVDDWRSAQIQIDHNAMPGVFWVSGEYDVDGIYANHHDKLTQAVNEHTEWCRRLVKMADDLWQESKKHRHIAGTMIKAAEFLRLKRDWAEVYKTPPRLIECPACAASLPESAVICRFCSAIINEERAADFRFAGQRA